MAKHKGGLLATVLLQVLAVKADTLVMGYSKMGVVIHMLLLSNRAGTCARPSEVQHAADNPPQGISQGRFIDQLDNGLNFLLSQLSVILRGVLDCRSAQNRRELKTVVRNISNEGVSESLGLTGFKFFDSVASDLVVHIETEVLEALVDTQVQRLGEILHPNSWQNMHWNTSIPVTYEDALFKS